MGTDESAREPDVTGFWSWFKEHEQELLDIIGGRREGRVTEMIDRALEASGIKATYEVTESAVGGELTFTPEGDPALGRFLDYFVAAAPALERWKTFCRVQRKPLNAALAFVRAIHHIDLGDAQLKLVVADDRYHLCFLHDALFALDEDRRFAIASTFLDHALGEETVMEFIGTIEFRRAGEGASLSLIINEIIRETSEPAAAPAT